MAMQYLVSLLVLSIALCRFSFLFLSHFCRLEDDCDVKNHHLPLVYCFCMFLVVIHNNPSCRFFYVSSIHVVLVFSSGVGVLFKVYIWISNIAAVAGSYIDTMKIRSLVCWLSCFDPLQAHAYPWRVKNQNISSNLCCNSMEGIYRALTRLLFTMTHTHCWPSSIAEF